MVRCAKFLYFVTFLLLIAGCAVIPPPALPTVVPAPAENPGASLVGTQWQLISYGLTGATTPVSVEPAVTLYFRTGGDAGGQSGCNTYGGRYQVQENMISFIRIVSTQIACADEQVMQIEQQYLDALPEAGRFELTPNELTIWYDDGSGVLTFAPLAATTPVLTTTPLPTGTPEPPSSELPGGEGTE